MSRQEIARLAVMLLAAPEGSKAAEMVSEESHENVLTFIDAAVSVAQEIGAATDALVLPAN